MFGAVCVAVVVLAGLATATAWFVDRFAGERRCPYCETEFSTGSVYCELCRIEWMEDEVY